MSYQNNCCDYVYEQISICMSVLLPCLRKSTSRLELLVFFTFINFFLKTITKSIIYCQTVHAFRMFTYVSCEKGMSGFPALVLTGIVLFRSMPNGNCLFGSASLSLVGDNSLVHELRVIAAVDLHL